MKYEIDIEGLPKGWKPVAYRFADKDEYILFKGNIEHTDQDGIVERLIVEKIQPRRIVLEETGEVRKAVKGEFCEDATEFLFSCQVDESAGKYKIWREVK